MIVFSWKVFGSPAISIQVKQNHAVRSAPLSWELDDLKTTEMLRLLVWQSIGILLLPPISSGPKRHQGTEAVFQSISSTLSKSHIQGEWFHTPMINDLNGWSKKETRFSRITGNIKNTELYPSSCNVHVIRGNDCDVAKPACVAGPRRNPQGGLSDFIINRSWWLFLRAEPKNNACQAPWGCRERLTNFGETQVQQVAWKLENGNIPEQKSLHASGACLMQFA